MLIRPARAEDIEEVLAQWSDAEAEPTHTDNPASLRLLLRHDPEAVLVRAAQIGTSGAPRL